MSEYQFYEFRSIDRPLTAEEQQKIGRWSSRAHVTSTGATFVYNYGDFRKDPKQVVAEYFDAMFYIANWGTTTLMLKFPKELLDTEVMQQYCTVDEISLTEHGECCVLEMSFSDEDGYGWIDGEGYLSPLIGLRQDILHGDYRSVHIAWLHACSRVREWEGFDATLLEPLLSRSFAPLNGALASFVELLDVNQDLLSVIVESRIGRPESASDDSAEQIALLPVKEKDDFLLRILREEPLLSVKLLKRLQSLSTQSDTSPMSSPRRTIGEIFQEIEKRKQQRQAADHRKREEKKRRKLAALEAEEATLWQKVSRHISEKTPKAYDAAVVILKDLLLLAKHRGTQPEYEQRVRGILKEYSRLSSLKSKVTRAKLLRNSM